MKIELIDLTEDNIKQCFELKVSDSQMQYIASNEDSWKEAKENNTTALSLYRKAGFRDTGEMNDEEIVLQLNL